MPSIVPENLSEVLLERISGLADKVDQINKYLGDNPSVIFDKKIGNEIPKLRENLWMSGNYLEIAIALIKSKY